MNDEKIIAEAKSMIKATMMDYIFEPLNKFTVNAIEANLSAALSEVISIDNDFQVLTELTEDNKIEVTVFIPNVGKYGNTKLTGRYTDCPAISSEEQEKNIVTAFDDAMAVVCG